MLQSDPAIVEHMDANIGRLLKVLEDDWKLILGYKHDRLELYNVREDVSESRNVAEV